MHLLLVRPPGPDPIGDWLPLAAGVFVLGLCGGVAVARAAARGRLRRHSRRGRRAERTALHLLRRAGYVVLQTQAQGNLDLKVDGEARSFPLRADALLRRRRRLYLAEIKGGRESARLENRATRRQLLEYAVAFPVDGVLLVDVSGRRILRVEFFD